MIQYKKLLFVAFIFIAISVSAQVVPPPVPPPPPPGLPIDGGLIFLLIAGALYGISKLKK